MADLGRFAAKKGGQRAHEGKLAPSPELVALVDLMTAEEFAAIEKRRAEKTKLGE
jgi:hypothetical protein